jgi:hypothetical protein
MHEEITVYGYLPRSPNASGRQHWGRKLHERCFWESVFGRHAWDTGMTRATGKRWVEWEFWKPGKVGLRDEDNLIASIKVAQDALVNLGLLVDDSPEWMELRGVTESNGHQQYVTHVRIGEHGDSAAVATVPSQDPADA